MSAYKTYYNHRIKPIIIIGARIDHFANVRPTIRECLIFGLGRPAARSSQGLYLADCITFTGAPHDGPYFCALQAIAVDFSPQQRIMVPREKPLAAHTPAQVFARHARRLAFRWSIVRALAFMVPGLDSVQLGNARPHPFDGALAAHQCERAWVKRKRFQRAPCRLPFWPQALPPTPPSEPRPPPPYPSVNGGQFLLFWCWKDDANLAFRGISTAWAAAIAAGYRARPVQ
jgi:hypothetical protein